MSWPPESHRVEKLPQMRRRFNEYLIHERNLSPMTAYTYENNLRCIERFVGKDAATIGPNDLRRFLRESPLHPQTKNGVAVGMKAFHRWGALEELWPLNGIASVAGPRLIKNPKSSLTTDEANALLKVVTRPNEVRLVYLGLYAGLRVGEMARVDEGAWLEDRLRFMGKGRKVRDVPVHPALEAKRETILARTTTDSTLKQVVRSLVYATGIEFSSHSLRRTFAVTLSEARIPREVIGSILGHAPLSVTETYAPIRWTEKLEAMDTLSYDKEATS
jgi:site-specific recombinase XerD